MSGCPYEQAQEGVSLEAQEEKIKAWAVLHDLKLVKIIRDEGKSGKDMERPGIQRLIELAQGAEQGAVIVYKSEIPPAKLKHYNETLHKTNSRVMFGIRWDG